MASYSLIDTKKIILKYEIYSKYKRIYIYLNNWNEFTNLYKIIPDNYKYFYEVINDYCNFFLNLDADFSEIEFYIWKKYILIIKKELKQFFKKTFNKDINILEYNSLIIPSERKYSCHLIVTDYIFKSEECINICQIFINELKDKDLNITNIINKYNVYGKNKCLRIENSKKI